MIWVDYCIIVVALISVLTGAIRGFTKEVFGVITWVAAVAFAWFCGGWIIALLRLQIANPALSTAAGYAAAFLLGLIVGSLISSLIVELIRNSRFSPADRTIGAGYGLIRALLLAALFIMVAGNMGARQEKWWGRSLFVSHLEWLANGLQILVPVSWLEKIQPDEHDKPDASQSDSQSDQPKKAKPER